MDKATTGLVDGGKFIHRGPDGKGGLVTVMQQQGTSSKQVGVARWGWRGHAIILAIPLLFYVETNVVSLSVSAAATRA
jgi:hypothetical protein